jgi:hypothetical protein
MRWIRFVLGGALLIGACTQPSADDASPSPPASMSPSDPPSVVPAGTRLADGTPLPDGCTGAAVATQTVAFVADGRAWALDHVTGDLSCLFPVENAGPFAWGPQGDRVLLGDFEIRGVSAGAPHLPAVDTSIGAFDWGHPIGLAVAFADRKGNPRKRLVDEGGRLIRLVSLPPGEYLEVAYHPSGLALAFVIDDEEGQSIWLSTNEGEDPQRLVFSEVGTKFTSIAFTPNGRALWWTADHRQGYTEMHWMNLNDRSGFGTGWRGPIPSNSDNLRLATGGRFKSVDEGMGCGDRQALIVEGDSTVPALPGETLPTTALGWLDRTTLLVAAGGCDEPQDLYAVDATGEDEPALVVLGVEQAAPRTQVTDPPETVPAPSPEEEPPPEGVG